MQQEGQYSTGQDELEQALPNEKLVEAKPRHALIVLNPVAGRTTPEGLKAILDTSFKQRGWEYEVYETKPDDNIGRRVRREIDKGVDLVIAAGGDGTVSLVADSLVNTDIPLGILPAGSANVLALELGLPNDLAQAAEVLAGDHRELTLDLMKAEGRYFILQIGIGLDAMMIQDTDRRSKRIAGRWAYMSTLGKKMLGFQGQRFTIVVDGKRLRPRAAQILVANAGTLGIPPFRWGPDISLSDGQLNLCIARLRTIKDYPRVAWQLLKGDYSKGSNIDYLPFTKQVTITTDAPLPIQADGEIIGETPIRISVVPQGLRVIVPVAVESEKPVTSVITMAREADKRAELEEADVEAIKATEQTRAVLDKAIAQISTPEHADQVIADLEKIAKGKTQEGVGEATPMPADAKQAADVIAELGKETPSDKEPQAVIAETAKQMAAASKEDQKAISAGVQAATNPKLTEVSTESTAEQRQMLQDALLRRLNKLDKLDAQAFLAINSLPHPELANQFMYLLTTVMNRGDAWIAGLVIATLLNHRHRRSLFEILPPLWLMTATVEYPIKRLFRRQRPFITLVRAIVVGRKPGNYSFPSGHSAAAFGGAWLLMRRYPKLAPLFYFVALLTGFSRSYLGAHYPGDVIIGGLAGTALAEGYRRLINEVGNIFDD